MVSLPPKIIMRRPSMEEEEIENVSFEKTEKKTEPETEIIIHLTADDPNFNKNEVIYTYNEKSFKAVDKSNQLAIHFELNSKIVNPIVEPEKDPNQLVEPEPEVVVPVREKETHELLINHFNYSERITQTPIRKFKTEGVQTDPPLTSVFAGNAIQWMIYDYYVEQEALKANKESDKLKQKEAEKHVSEKKEEEAAIATKGGLWRFKSNHETIDLSQMTDSLRIMERIINQNTFDEITQDFKYWDDLSDDLKSGRGSLLPLWKFQFDEVKDLHVTDVCWNPIYDDLFAASYGSYDFMKQRAGMLCVFCLSNPSYPEFLMRTNCGLLCLSFHRTKPNLIAVGMYDGNVAVFDLQDTESKAMCQSQPDNGKHAGPVWQVEWQPDDVDGNLNFSSASSDGRVTYWTVIKKQLMFSDMLHIRRKEQRDDDLSHPMTTMNASVTAVAFHPLRSATLLVGADDGSIYRCNRNYVQGVLTEYETHDHLVNRIQWNRFHPHIFLSCSFDRTVKIWDHRIREPLWSYALDSAVTDAKWAPYSATVFAAITKDGKAYVYDLHMSKYQPICVQMLVPKSQANPYSLAFSEVHPCILVGDARGCVRAFKLSPNLRRSLPRVHTENHKEQEVGLLERYIAIVKDPLSKYVDF